MFCLLAPRGSYHKNSANQWCQFLMSTVTNSHRIQAEDNTSGPSSLEVQNNVSLRWNHALNSGSRGDS